jgi:two-component system phosphate regulon sensor histidine kinase PhoR
LERAEKGVERLVYIVEDLDMISKLEMGDESLEMVEFDMVELAQNVMDLLEIKANKKDITLSFDSKYYKPIMVLADYEKIQQVMLNLVMNSIKYGKEGGSTEIGIEDLTNNKVIVRVSDNGEGIEKQNIPRLFERFFRVDKSGARSEGGSGLGLSIVKHIIEAHDEKIYVQSKFGKGSEFSFTLEKV